MHIDHKAVRDLIRQIEADALAGIAADPADAECVAAQTVDTLAGVIQMLGICHTTALMPHARTDEITRATAAQTTVHAAAGRAQRGPQTFTVLPRPRGGILA